MRCGRVKRRCRRGNYSSLVNTAAPLDHAISGSIQATQQKTGSLVRLEVIVWPGASTLLRSRLFLLLFF